MPITPETTPDYHESEPHVRSAVTAAEREVLHNIGQVSTDVRRTLRTCFGSRTGPLNYIGHNVSIFPITSRNIERRAAHWQAHQHYKDLPWSERTRSRWEEAHQRAARSVIRDDDLGRLPGRDKIPNLRAKGKNNAGDDTDVTISFSRSQGQWPSGEVLKKALIPTGGGTPASSFGNVSITYNPAPPHHFEEAQADELVRKYEALTKLSATLASRDTTPLQVQTALAIAHEHPEEVLQALTQGGPGELKKKLDEAKAKREVLGQIESVSRIQREVQTKNWQEIYDESGNVAQDLKHLEDTVNRHTPLSAVGLSEVASYEITNGQINGWHQVPRAKPGTPPQPDFTVKKAIRESLKRSEKELKDSAKYYIAVESALTSLRDYLLEKQIEFGDKFNLYFQNNGKGSIIMGNLKPDFDPSVFITGLREKLQLKTKEEYDHEVTDLEGKVKKVSPLTGKDSVLAIYQKHFELPHLGQNQEVLPGMSADQARAAALEEFARNAVTRSDVQHAKRIASTPEVMGPEKGIIRPIDRTKELLFGTEEAFVCNLSQSYAMTNVGLGTRLLGGGPLGRLREQRRLFILWRKSGARPHWGRATFPQLVVAYHGLRKGIHDGHISGTPYVRAQLEELTQLIMDRAVRNHEEVSGLVELTDEQKESLKATNDRHMVRELILGTLLGDASRLPQEYQQAVNASVEYAAKYTGRVRKAVGSFTAARGKNLIVKGSGWNPVTWPAKTVVTTAKVSKKVVWDWPKKGVRNFWHWATQTSTFFGSGGGAHH